MADKSELLQWVDYAADPDALDEAQIKQALAMCERLTFDYAARTSIDRSTPELLVVTDKTGTERGDPFFVPRSIAAAVGVRHLRSCNTWEQSYGFLVKGMLVIMHHEITPFAIVDNGETPATAWDNPVSVVNTKFGTSYTNPLG